MPMMLPERLRRGTSLVSIAGTSAYTPMVVSCTVIFLFLSFTFPITLGLLA